MGNEIASKQIYARLSRHNSPRDDEHDKLWAEALTRIEEILHDPKYEAIGLDWY